MSNSHTLSNEPSTSDSASNDKTVSERNRILGMLGSIVFFIWVLMVYFGGAIIMPQNDLAPLFMLLGLTGICVGFFATRFISNRLITPVLRISTFVFIALVFLCYLFVLLELLGAQANFAILLVQWFLMGIVTAEILIEIGLFYIHLYVVRGNYMGPYTVAGVVIAGIVFFILTRVNLPSLLIVTLLPLIAQILLVVFPVWFPTKDIPAQRNGLELPEYRRTVWGLLSYLLITGFLAIFWSTTLGLPFQSSDFWIFALGVILGGILFGIIPILFKGKATLNLTRWFLLPVPVAILLLIPIVDFSGQLALCVVWFTAFTSYLVACLTTLVSLPANDTTINVIGSFSLAGILGVLGMGLGWSFGTYVVAFQDIIPVNIVSIVLVLFFLVSFTVFYKPLSSYQDSAASKGRWKRRCDEICEMHSLSPREKEVFYLLSKGRNAEFIQNVLYISTHTAKTHIYHIYRKLNIHTQQELLDMFDVTAPPKQDESVAE